MFCLILPVAKTPAWFLEGQYMQYVIPPIKIFFYPNKIPDHKNTEDNFHEVQTTKCTKILYQTDTICPAVLYSALKCSAVQ